MRHPETICVSMLICICLAGCTRNEASAPPLSPEQNAAKTRLEEQRTKAAQTAQTYHAMDNTTLLGHLVEQSKSLKEPFNSLAYRELKTRTDIDPKALSGLVGENQNAAGLLPLLLLRRLNNKAYLDVPAETRAKVLTDALRASKTFNTWGLPGFYLEDASNAMIETGRSTVPALKRMLDDTRPAPLFGSKEYMLSQRLKYRLCDYALYFLRRIGGDEQFKLPAVPEERDALIKAAQKG